MTNYKIKWEIDIEATSHEEAAKKALELQKDDSSLATIFSVTDMNGYCKEIDVQIQDEMIDHIGNIKRIIGRYGYFTTFDVEADSSPSINSIGNVMQLAECFYLDYATCTTYIGSREESEEDLTYEQLGSVDPFIVEHISSLADDWEAESLRTEKRIAN